MNNLNLKQSPITYPKIEEFRTDHDYEALSPSYNINKPTRPAPRPPSAKSPIPVTHGSPVPNVGPTSPVVPSRRKGPAPLPRNTIYKTLDGYNGMEGVPFFLNPKLRGLPSDAWVSSLLILITFSIDDDDEEPISPILKYINWQFIEKQKSLIFKIL